VTSPRLPDLLVTGTDTGVGKTVIAAALVLARRGAGVRAIGFKPAESGVGGDGPADSAILAAASGSAEPLAIPLAQLTEPLAPALAAERTGVAIDAAAIETRVRSLRAAGWSVIVEGAGGILVPLAWDYTALELAARLGLEAVVVGRAGLGTLNHVQLTVDALRRRDVPVRAVVLNGRGDPPDLAESTNPSALERLLPGTRILEIPRYETIDPLEAARRAAPGLAGL
jgi:dethiobiotin synthetase